MSRMPEGHSGRLFEAEVLGSGVAKTKWLARAHELGAAENGYLPYEKAIQLAREFQPGDPTNPEKDTTNDLRLAIIDRLEERGFLEPGEEDSVKLFNSVGMPLDHFHGVDAFIEFTDKGGNTYRVTLDETVDSNKLHQGHKANIIFPPLPDAVQQQDEYLAEIDQLADDAMEFLERDIKQRAAA